MGATTSSSPVKSRQNSTNSKHPDLVVRDHTFDYDNSGIEYLKAHEIPQLFQDITARLLTERPLDSLRFIRNILIHKVIHQQDHNHRINIPSLKQTNSLTNLVSTKHKQHNHSPKIICNSANKNNINNNNNKLIHHSAKLNPITTSCKSELLSLNINNYDADKLLESRTTKRTRSYSDSAIEIMNDNNRYNTQKSFDFITDSNISNINVNALSQPYNKLCSITPTNNTNINIETISSVMDDMNINKVQKNTLMKIFTDNINNEEKKIDNINDNINNINDNRSISFSKISNRFRNELKSLSMSAKAIPSKIKKQVNDIYATETQTQSLQIYSKSEDAENINKNSDNINECVNELYIDNKPKITAAPQPLRRSRTMDQLISPLHHHVPFRHILSLSLRPCFGFDIGGSLTKISFFEPFKNSRWNIHDKVKTKFVTSNDKYGTSGIRDKNLSFPWRNGTFHFIHFQTHRMKQAVQLWKNENLLQKNEIFYATGGGAHKYSKFFTDKLSVKVKKGDELKCLISGLNFLLNHVPDECYYLSDPASKKPSPKISWNIKKEGSVFPYLLVNIGSGVSILKVDSPIQFERVSGSQIGGGTYWGLCRLCSYSVQQENEKKEKENKLTFRKAFELAIKGNAKKVNMLVSDIYGGDYKQCNLPGDLVASAFGKCISIINPKQELLMGDIARGLLDVIAMNCAQLAYLNAMRFKITRIIFAGNFLRQNDLSMAMISYAIHYWSQGVIKACFLKHEGYFGSIGVMLLPDNELIDDDDDDSDDNDNDSNDNDNDSNDNDNEINTINEH